MGRAPRAVQPMSLSRTRQRMAPGGRMWGESPIRELQNDRLLLRGAGGPPPPATPLDSWYVHTAHANGLTTTLPSLDGVSQAIAVLGSIGATNVANTLPAGWTIHENIRNNNLYAGFWSPLNLVVASIDAVQGDEGLTFAWEPWSGHRYIRGYAVYSYGGQGGSWQYSIGYQEGDPAGLTVPMLNVPAGAPFAQLGVGRALGGGIDAPAPSGMDTAGGAMGRFGWYQGWGNLQSNPPFTDEQVVFSQPYTSGGPASYSVSVWWS